MRASDRARGGGPPVAAGPASWVVASDTKETSAAWGRDVSRSTGISVVVAAGSSLQFEGPDGGPVADPGGSGDMVDDVQRQRRLDRQLGQHRLGRGPLEVIAGI